MPEELLQNALPLLAPALLPVFLLLLAPLCGRRARTAIGTLLLVVGLGFVADVLLLDHSEVRTLAVPNVFPSPREPRGQVWIVANESAPAWQYHVVIASVLGLAGLMVLARRNRTPHAPHPALYGTGIGIAWLATRLLLEKTAAPAEVIWATGLTLSLLLILPFVGWYSGARGLGVWGLVKQLAAMALFQRMFLVGFACWATTGSRGTHLDTHRITDTTTPFGDVQFEGDAVRNWLWLACFPHLTIWIVLTIVVGTVLGIVPLLLARRRRPAEEEPVEAAPA